MDKDLSTMIGKIMSNPEFQKMADEMRGQMEQSGETPDIGKMLSSLGLGAPNNGTVEQNEPSKEPEAAATSLTSPMGKFDKARAERLMKALRPYLSKSRCDMLDRCMSVMSVSDVIGALGGIPGITK